MAILIKGPSGPFIGKVGDKIGSSWKNIYYVKSLPRKSNKPPTVKQLEQRSRFATVTSFFKPFAGVVKIGWSQMGTSSPMNRAVKHALAEAVTGTYPNYAVDPALVLLSKGILARPYDVTIQSDGSNSLSLEWGFSPECGNYYANDSLTVVVYHTAHEMALAFENIANRFQKSASIDLPTCFSGEKVHVYLFFVQHSGKERSNSVCYRVSVL